MLYNFNTAFDYLLMLIIFHVQNVIIISDWCQCDFLVLKDIDEVDAPHLYLSFSVLEIFFLWKMFQNLNIVFDYLVMYIIFNRCLCDFLVPKHINEVDTLHFHLLFTDGDIFFVWKISIYFFDYLLMLTIFSCAKCSYHSWLMFMWFSCTETYRGHLLILTYFCVENIPEFQYWFWLFTDVDYFSCAKRSFHSQLMSMWSSETYL